VPPHRKPTALIVDDDVGFIFWLGEIFGKAGWNLVPALNCRQAVSLAVMWEMYIDLVVVNPALSGVSEMVETLSRVHRPKIVIIRDPDVEAPILGDATINRPDLETSASRARWAERLRTLLKRIGPEPDGRTGI
jgi:hypothetical protein